MLDTHVTRLMNYITRHAEKICVRDTINGKTGNYRLSEMPATDAIRWAFHWVKRNQTPHIVQHNEGDPPANDNLGLKWKR